MNDQALKISKKTFISSVLILLVLMIAAGVLALTLPQGSYERTISDGREVVVADSYTAIENGTRLPFYRIFTAPFEVLASDDAVTIIGIIVFIVLISGSIGLLNQSGVMSYAMHRVVAKNKEHRYRLLLLIAFIFMFFGAFVGVFEESATLVPFAVALSLAMGWDSLVGTGHECAGRRLWLFNGRQQSVYLKRGPADCRTSYLLGIFVPSALFCCSLRHTGAVFVSLRQKD